MCGYRVEAFHRWTWVGSRLRSRGVMELVSSRRVEPEDQVRGVSVLLYHLCSVESYMIVSLK